MSAVVATAFAPASVGNVGVGFDILGHSIEGAGDTVTVRKTNTNDIRVLSIRGTMTSLPLETEKNTAARALRAMREHLHLPFGFEIEIEKGIALGSGMGGSAASATAAVPYGVNTEFAVRFELLSRTAAPLAPPAGPVGMRGSVGDMPPPLPVPGPGIPCAITWPDINARRIGRILYMINLTVLHESYLLLFL